MPDRSVVSLTLLALAAGSATSLAQTDRYWVAPLIGFWDDAGNWSLSEGGPVGGGIPQNDDLVRFTTRSTCLFDGQLGLPVQANIILAGTGSGQGRTLLSQSAGLLRSGIIRVGNGTLRNDLKISGGSLNAENIFVGEFGGEGLLEISGTGSVGPISSFNRLTVGFAEGMGTVNISGGSANFDEVYLSIDSVTGTLGGPADLLMTGGTLDIDEFYVGYGGRGFARFFGGTATAGSCTVGFAGESGALRPQLNVGTGGDLEITGTLTIGDFEETVGEEPGFGRVLVTGGSLNAGRVDLAQDAGTDGELIVDGGFFNAFNMDVGLGGDGSVTLDSGSLWITNRTAVGAALAAPGSVGTFEINAGSFTTNILSIGEAADSEGVVTISGGGIDATAVRVGDAPGADGTLNVDGGLIETDTLDVGVNGEGYTTVSAGTVDTSLLTIGGSLIHNAYVVVNGGTLLADEIDVARDMSSLVTEQLFVREGLVVSNELRIASIADVRFGFGFPFEARVSTIINNGRFDFTGIDSVLSGPILFGNVRLLGTLINNGDFTFRSGAPDDAFVMNLINSAEFEVSPAVRAIVGGAITNQPTGSILVRRDTDADPGRLEARNTGGFANDGTLELENGIVATPNGSLTNSGTLIGWGEIDSDLVNNGSILPSPDPQPQSRELVVDSLQSGPASSVRVVITENGHNSITSLGSTALDGTLNLAFAQGVPLPPRGTEYDLVVSPNEIIAGNFASAAILGYPCEIISGRNRVFARTLRCNVADFAQPFGVLDLADIGVFTSGFTGGNPLVDINGDTILDLADIGLFVAAFTGGCP